MSVAFGLHPEAFGTEQITYYTQHLADEAEAADLSSPVVTCGDWTLADLIWHLTEVQDFWAWIIEHRPAGPEEYARPDRPADPELVAGLRERNRRLVAKLLEASPDEAAWTWHPVWQTVNFTHRRQSHEAMIHCFDGFLAIGAERPEVSGRLAADGFDELVTVVAGGVPEWARYASSGLSLAVNATDTGDSWLLEIGSISGRSPGGTVYEDLATIKDLDSDGDASIETQVTGTALDIDLWAWGRGSADRLTVAGAEEPVRRLRALVVESTQ